MFRSWVRSWKPARNIVPIAIIMVILGVIAFNIANGVASPSWPSAVGTITRSELYTSFEDQSTSPYITYEFTVDGQQYTGDTITYGFSSGALERYPKGSAARIYYSPSNPRISVLEPGFGIQAMPPAAKILLLVLVIALLGVIIALAKTLIPKKRPQPDL